MSEIRDGIYAHVSGTVGRVFQTRNGAALELHVQRENAKYPDRVTVWGAADNVTEGDRIALKGWFEAQLDSYEKDGETKWVVRRSLNKPQVVAHEPQAQEAWSGGGSDGAPF